MNMKGQAWGISIAAPQIIGRGILLIYLWPALTVSVVEFVVDAGGTIAHEYRRGGLEAAIAVFGSAAWDAASTAIPTGLLWPWEVWRLL